MITCATHFQVDELNVDCDSLRKQNFDLQETICSQQAEIKGLKVECGGECQTSKYYSLKGREHERTVLFIKKVLSS